MQGLFFFVLGIIGVFVVLTLSVLNKRKALLEKIEKSFGKKPEANKSMHQPTAYWEEQAKVSDLLTSIDDITWNDLDLEEVYQRVNSCYSMLGDVALYNAMRLQKSNPALLQGKNSLLECMEQNPMLRKKVQVQLALLGRRNSTKIEIPAFLPDILTMKQRWIPFLLAALLLLGSVPVAILAGLPYGLLFAAGVMIINLNYSAISKGRNDTGFRSVLFIASVIGRGQKLRRILEKEAPEVAKQLEQSLAPFKKQASLYSVLAFSDLSEEWIGFDAMHAFCIPLMCFAKTIHKMQQQAEQIRQLFYIVGWVDICQSILSTCESLPCICRPEYIPQNEIQGESIYHPLVEEPVLNHGSFTNCALFTGSNASGKSTFIKAIAVNLLLGQSLDFCCATKFSFRRGTVATSMAVADNIVEGESYFIAEIKSLRRLLSRIGKGDFCYLFVDEILKGTNTIERVAASASVLEYISKSGNLCFTATHDIELTQMLEKTYTNYHFTETITNGEIRFDYTLYNGPAKSRNAIVLLDTMGFPQEVVGNARRLVQQKEATGEWENL